MKNESLSVRFLHQTKFGRLVLKMLVNPCISKIAGVYLSSRFSAWLAPMFIRKNKIDMTGYPKRKYASFNDFFTRQRDNEIDKNPDHLISPCDALLTVYPIDEDSVYRIKHSDYGVAQLLEDADLARQYAGGLCLMFRLTPKHYHRYCYICGGKVEKTKRIDGKLHCVRPVAYNSVPVFVENSREYTVIQSETLGKVVQMEVGALLVGKIKNYGANRDVAQGMEKGYFEFGGSTIIVLLEKDKAVPEMDILKCSELGIETEVRFGSKIGEKIR